MLPTECGGSNERAQGRSCTFARLSQFRCSDCRLPLRVGAHEDRGSDGVNLGEGPERSQTNEDRGGNGVNLGEGPERSQTNGRGGRREYGSESGDESTSEGGQEGANQPRRGPRRGPINLGEGPKERAKGRGPRGEGQGERAKGRGPRGEGQGERAKGNQGGGIRLGWDQGKSTSEGTKEDGRRAGRPSPGCWGT